MRPHFSLRQLAGVQLKALLLPSHPLFYAVLVFSHQPGKLSLLVPDFHSLLGLDDAPLFDGAVHRPFILIVQQHEGLLIDVQPWLEAGVLAVLGCGLLQVVADELRDIFEVTFQPEDPVAQVNEVLPVLLPLYHHQYLVEAVRSLQSPF